MTDSETAGPPGSRSSFPDTRFSLVRATGSHDPRLREDAWELLIRSYWRPVYKYIRTKWRADEERAKDLTQEFFTRALDAGFFERFDPGKARFRTWLRVCLHGFVANEFKAAARKKRGGDYRILSLDFEDAERELRQTSIADDVDADDYFRQESIRSLFGEAVTELRERLGAAGKATQLAVFERYDLAGDDVIDRPTYQSLAAEFGIPVTQVTNYLAAVRREFRRIVLDRLREISGTEREFRVEAIELLGVDPDDVAV
jgi:RNA polymerase sigma factor (sigma-70 family)